jgi:hypothetical protein
LLKTRVKAKCSIVEGNGEAYKSEWFALIRRRILVSSTCVLLRRKSIVATPDPLLRFTLLRD